MSSPLPTLGSTVKGEWRIETLESRALQELRKRALAAVGGGNTNGTMAEWIVLAPEIRSRADVVLAGLVEEHRDEIESADAVAVADTGFHPNLLVDSGMNYICGTATRVDFFAEARLGLGTTPTVYDSVAVTASAAGTGVTASADFFTVGMVGMLLRWDGGSQSYIASVTDATHAVLATSVTASGLFAVHAVNRTALATPSVSASTKVDDSPTISGGVFTRTMSWVFGIETVNKNYTEGGIIATGSTFLSLFLLTGGTVTILIGQQAKLYYAFSISVVPTAQSATWPFSEYDTGAPGGWDSPTGQGKVISLRSIHGWAPYHGASLLPSIDPGSDRGYISTTSSLMTFTEDSSTGITGAIGSYVTGSKSTYVNGNFYRDSTYTFPATHSDTSAIRSFFVAEYYGKVAWQFLFDSAKTKDGNHSLSLTIRRSISRTLTNP